MQRSLFALSHPLVIFAYFVGVIVLSMCTLNPFCVALSFICASLMYCATAGLRKWARSLLLFSPAIILIAGANFLFNRVGETVLFMLGDARFTLEALIFGCTSAVLFLSIILWFLCYQEIMTNDKFLCLFGRIAPSTSLVVSMIFRFIPQLTKQGHAILMSQKTLKRSTHSRKDGIAHTARVTSILMGWSLEESIHTADAMRARGFGAHQRTTYTPYSFDLFDGVILGVLLCVIVASSYFIFTQGQDVMFYPYFEMTVPSLSFLLVYGALLLFPFLVEVRGVLYARTLF